MRVLIYSDSPVFGGHEEMLVKHLERTSWPSGVRVTATFPRENDRLRVRLSALAGQGKLETAIELKYSRWFADQFTGLVRPFWVYYLYTLISAIKPNVVVIVAGRIENGNWALWCARALDIPCVSYVPMVHQREQIAPSAVARLRDNYNRCVYRSYASHITISPTQASALTEMGCVASIVPNIVDSPATARGFRKLSGAVIRLGYIGRIVTAQKNVLFLSNIVRTIRREGILCTLTIQGDGPAKERLASELAEFGSDIDFIPWDPDVSKTLAKIDMLVIPSLFEGVPLVMLQAILNGIRVVATAVDGMVDYLPPSALFEVNNERQAFDAIIATFQSETDVWERVRRRYVDEVHRAARGNIFSSSILNALLCNRGKI